MIKKFFIKWKLIYINFNFIFFKLASKANLKSDAHMRKRVNSELSSDWLLETLLWLLLTAASFSFLRKDN